MKKKSRHTNNILPWTALALVSLIAMAYTIVLTNTLSREIEHYINPENQLLVHEKTGHAWVEIDFSGKRKRLFESNLGLERYALAAVLAEIAKTAHFSLRIAQGEIKELAGVSAGTGSWNVYRYDTRVNQPLDKLTIAGNDYYRIKLER